MGILVSNSLASVQHSADVSQIQRIADHLAWLNDDTDNSLESYPGPSWTADDDRYEPDPFAAAQEGGWTRGYDLDYSAEPPASLTGYSRAFWLIGKATGIQKRLSDDAERADFERDLAESAFRFLDPHPSESIAANGVLAYRKGGSL